MENKDIKVYSQKENLIMFKNDWNSKLTARLIDLVHDQQTKERDPNAMVLTQNPTTGQYKEVKVDERINNSKFKIQDALDILKAIDTLLVDMESETVSFENKYFSKDTLKIVEEAEVEKVGVESPYAHEEGKEE